MIGRRERTEVQKALFDLGAGNTPITGAGMSEEAFLVKKTYYDQRFR
jgi:hypothetical protein